MHLREFDHTMVHGARTGGVEYRISLTVDVTDADALWSAAAAMALSAPGATMAGVVDTLGPREDPSICACLAMLASPALIAGCGLAEFHVEETLDLTDFTALPR